MNQKLKKTIQNQLQSLENKLENIRNWQIETDEDMWDSDHYSNLLEEIEAIRDLLKKEEGLLENLEIWQQYKDIEENDNDE